ncbi:MAG: NAD(P)-dependent oxidoreductase [Caldilineaceae bacterium]
MTDKSTDRLPDEPGIRPRRVLITGAAGAIGRVVGSHLLARGHSVRGFDMVPVPALADHHVGNLADRSAVRSAVAGMDTVIHLAAYRNDADFMEVLLEPNVIGLYEICEAAQLAGVERLVLASTMQVINGFGEADEPIAIAAGAKPTNHYALTKQWAEITGAMYARCHNLSVINVRIGWFPRDQIIVERMLASARGTDLYFSHADAERFFARCVESTAPVRGKCVTLFAASKAHGRARFDFTTARATIGYVPHDRWPEGIPFPVQ